MDDVLALIAPALEQNAVGDYVSRGETRTEIWGTVSSVSRAEWYNAGHEGFNPDMVFTTPLVNYCRQPEAEYHGIRYGIYRTYFRDDSDMIELYLQRKAGVQ